MSLAPTRMTGWASAFRGPVQTLVGPVSGTLSSVASWLRPAVRDEEPRPSDLELLRQRDAALRELQKANNRVKALERRLGFVDEVERLVGDAVRPRRAPVIGQELGAGTVSVRGGSLAGVPRGAVAIDPVTLQLVGRVEDVGPTTASVSIITAKVRGRERWISGRAFDPGAQLMDAEAQATLPLLDLRPIGGGMFESAEAPRHELLEPGALVKLDDGAWPAYAQFLVLGRVTAVEDADNPLMCVVRVRPLIDDLAALPALELLVPDDTGNGAGGSGAGGAVR